MSIVSKQVMTILLQLNFSGVGSALSIRYCCDLRQTHCEVCLSTLHFDSPAQDTPY